MKRYDELDRYGGFVFNEDMHFIYGGFGPSEKEIERDFYPRTKRASSNTKPKSEVKTFNSQKRYSFSQDGHVHCFRPDGSIAGTGFHVERRLIGPFEGYDNDGKLLYSINYAQDGTVKQMMLYHPNGKPCVKITNLKEDGVSSDHSFSLSLQDLPFFITDNMVGGNTTVENIADVFQKVWYADYGSSNTFTRYNTSGIAIKQSYKGIENKAIKEKAKSDKRAVANSMLKTISEKQINKGEKRKLKRQVVDAYRKECQIK